MTPSRRLVSLRRRTPFTTGCLLYCMLGSSPFVTRCLWCAGGKAVSGRFPTSTPQTPREAPQALRNLAVFLLALFYALNIFACACINLYFVTRIHKKRNIYD